MQARSKLLSKNRKLIKQVTVEVDGEPVKADLRKPSFNERIKVIEDARAAGDLNDKSEPTNERAGVRMLARMAQILVYDPETRQPMFKTSDVDELIDETWLEDLAPELTAVFNKSVEAAQGN